MTLLSEFVFYWVIFLCFMLLGYTGIQVLRTSLGGDHPKPEPHH